MNPRAPLRQYYDDKASQAKLDKQHADRTAQIGALEDTVIKAFNALIRYMDGKTTKTEVVNQLKSISTPDVDKVVTALSKLDADVLSNKVDTKPLEAILTSIRREVSLIPKTHAEAPEQREDVRVTNLSDLKLDTSALEKAVKALKLDPTIDVKAPIVNVDKPDLKPLQDVMLDLLKAVNKIEFPEFPELPETDLTKVEKKLDESNKHLKAIVEKPMGGGGGGNGTPYIDQTGKPMNVVLQDGAIPITDVSQQDSQLIFNEINEAVSAIASTRGIAADLRVTLLSGTVTTVTNLAQLGGLSAVPVAHNIQNQAAVQSNINNIVVS